MNNKFQKDLLEGERFEHKLLDHLNYIKYEKMQGYFKEYDLKVYKSNKKYTTIEVKSDKQINIYGNICIEYECKNKPSGISTTTAKYWAIFEPKNDKYSLYLIPTKIIKEKIKNKEYNRNCIGGDNKASKLYLFDKNLFKDYIIYTNLS